MFLLNSRLGLFTAAPFTGAPLLPKLRGHFAEFLNEGYPARLRILSSPTCVGLWYGPHVDCRFRGARGFSRQPGTYPVRYLISLPVTLQNSPRDLPPGASFELGPEPTPGRVLLSVSPHRSTWRYRNVHLLSIVYAFRPRLRSRLTLSGRALPRKP